MDKDWEKPQFGGLCWFVHMAPEVQCVLFHCLPCWIPHLPAGTCSCVPPLQLFYQFLAGAWAHLPCLLGLSDPLRQGRWTLAPAGDWMNNWRGGGEHVPTGEWVIGWGDSGREHVAQTSEPRFVPIFNLLHHNYHEYRQYQQEYHAFTDKLHHILTLFWKGTSSNPFLRLSGIHIWSGIKIHRKMLF